MIIPIINAPLIFLITIIEVINNPIKNVTIMGFNFVIETKVAGLSTINLALTKPMNVMNNPIPAAIAYLICFGIALTINSRTFSTDKIIKTIPDQKTAPSATSHLTPIPKTTEKVKKAFNPIPGAKTIGLFA